MGDYRKMYDDKDYLYAYDLDDCPKGEDDRPERTLEIVSCSRVELTGENNKKSKKPGVSFKGEPKKLALNKTNGKMIAKLYGKDTEHWAGQMITIYATTTEFGGEIRDCIRVRPRRPDRGDGQSQRNDRRQDRGNNGKGRSGQGQSRDQGKADRSAAESSAIAAKYLIEQYAKVDGGPGQGDDRMAELKAERGKHWDGMAAEDREAVGVAAKAAKARIDAPATGAPVGNDQTGAATSDHATDASYDPDDDDDADDQTGSDPDADLETGTDR